ncbi:LIM domain-containing protein [Phlyctema vagabunda]|uniref:LIM domain-containing protein n=1 Tax=Phlyctema vagabunda TaxID=108571 RepID=A0ABR4PBP8_9HELO
MLRGRSKDGTRKVTPPGPVSMTNEQFADYLADLRNNRVARPSGARPQPASKRRDSQRAAPDPSPAPTPTQEDAPGDLPPRSTSVLSHRRTQSSLSNYSTASSRTGRALVRQPTSGSVTGDQSPTSPTIPLKPSEVVPTATYMERGQRWMEKEEAVSLREAMEDMDLKPQEEEEIRVHAAAQNEASELVYQHQNPNTAQPNPDAPFRYTEHLRKNSYAHARTQSVGRRSGLGMVTGLARDIAPPNISRNSSSSGELKSPRDRVSSDSSDYFRQDHNRSPERTTRESVDSVRTLPATTEKAYGSLAKSGRPFGSTRRRSSAKRNVSGEIAGSFTGEQIWEEPEQEDSSRGRPSEARDVPAPLQIKPRNPLNRVQFAHDLPPRSNSTPPEQVKKLSKYEIHRNPPSQSRNPAYTANPPPLSKAANDIPVRTESPDSNMRDGLELRSEEIRQATSMRLKDRSPKLPTPTAVSNKLGRPIVSFDKNWKPNGADTKSEEPRRTGDVAYFKDQASQSGQGTFTGAVPKIQLPDTTNYRVMEIPSVPSINVPDSRPSNPSIPTINLPDTTSISVSGPAIPTINIPDTPTISVSGPAIPKINLPTTPKISVSSPNVPTINTPRESTTKTRPLPDPKKATARPLPRHHATAPLPRGHWSPASGSRVTAACHQCQLPIEGRVVALRGVAERFHPHCFICFTCGTALEALEISPEPPTKRAERLDRIQRRAQGEELEEVEGQTIADDGDERLRFFCHLDWHEHFAPKCKHCKTPIIGEHAVALGEHWHYGHFFCAECGDPFEQGMTHIEKDGYAWCLKCQTKRTERRAPKCTKCKLPVIGQYVQAMGGEWHDACFKCVVCAGGFDDGQIFPKQVGSATVVLCTGCMERELKA